MDTWASVSDLTFTFQPRCRGADIRISFESGRHGDREAFDGEGGELAHTFFTSVGKIHFDNDEEWTTSIDSDGSGPVDLETVALHELGHAIGILDSGEDDAVMSDGYSGSRRDLTRDDIDAVQALYYSDNCLSIEEQLLMASDLGADAADAAQAAAYDTDSGYAWDAYESCMNALDAIESALDVVEYGGDYLRPYGATLWGLSLDAASNFEDCGTSAMWAWVYTSGNSDAMDAYTDGLVAAGFANEAADASYSCMLGM